MTMQQEFMLVSVIFFSGKNLQPMTIQQDQRMVSKIFFLMDELPAYDDATGSKVSV